MSFMLLPRALTLLPTDLTESISLLTTHKGTAVKYAPISTSASPATAAATSTATCCPSTARSSPHTTSLTTSATLDGPSRAK